MWVTATGLSLAAAVRWEAGNVVSVAGDPIVVALVFALQTVKDRTNLEKSMRINEVSKDLTFKLL